MWTLLSAALPVLVLGPLLAEAFHWTSILPPRPRASIDTLSIGGNCRRAGGADGRTSLLQIHFNDFYDLTSDEPRKNGVVNDCNGKSAPSSFPRLHDIFASPPVAYPSSVSSDLLGQFAASGFIDDNEMIQFAKGFVAREEVLSRIFIEDFGWEALDAHRARVGLMALVRAELGLTDVSMTRGLTNSGAALEDFGIGRPRKGVSAPSLTSDQSPRHASEPSNNLDIEGEDNDQTESTEEATKPALWKSVLVNDKAKIRRANVPQSKGGSESSGKGKGSASAPKDSYNYGLLQSTTDDSDSKIYPNFFAEMDSFWSHMTVPQTSAVAEAPIREQTAKVYLTHARLFLGWMVDARGVLSDTDPLEKLGSDAESGESFVQEKGEDVGYSSPLATTSSGTVSSQSNDANSVRVQTWKNVLERVGASDDTEQAQIQKELLKRSISLFDIFPTSQTESASPILQYILWLRSERHISPNYEANM